MHSGSRTIASKIVRLAAAFQELLGHRSLASHVYSQLAPERLAAVHRATYPGAALPGNFPL